MSSVNTNGAAMAAIRSLSMISRDMATTQSRVESGLRVNKANDDPAVFAIAQNMRADLSAMTAVRDSLAFGKAALTVARDAATKISDELGRLKQTITQGQQQGLDPNAINTQITNALENIDAYARSATFNGVNLLAQGVGAPGVTSTQVDIVRDIQGATTQVVGTNSTSAGLTLAGLNVNTGAWEVSFDNTLAPANAQNITVTVGGRDLVFEMSDGSAPLATTPDATTEVFDVQFTATDSPLQRLGAVITRMQDAGIDASLTNDGALVIRGAATAVTTNFTGAAAPAQIGGATGAIAVVEGAIDTMGTRLANLGANLRQVEGLSEFTKQLTDSVKEGLGALVDADLAEESARLTSLQTKQQLAVQSLSIANQQSQSLLSLFR
jgi:flagellin